MTTTPPDELISAYYDGELTPEEITVVEEYLKKSPQADLELKEIGLLSQLVHDLPPESQKAPVEFQSAVLKKIERESLLAEAKPVGSHWKKFFPYAAGLTTAASLFLIFQFISSSDQQFDSVSSKAETTSSAQQGVTVEAEESKNEIASVSQVHSKINSDTNSKSGGIGGNKSQTDNLNGVIASKKESLNGHKVASKPLPLNKPVIVTPAVHVKLEENNLNVIRVTVKNRVESLKQLEGCLLKQKIPINSHLAERDKELAESQDEEEMTAVYVEASETQIMAAINDLQSTPQTITCSQEPETHTRKLEPRFYSYLDSKNNSLFGAIRFRKNNTKTLQKERRQKNNFAFGIQLKEEAPVPSSPEDKKSVFKDHKKQDKDQSTKDQPKKKLAKAKPVPAKPAPFSGKETKKKSESNISGKRDKFDVDESNSTDFSESNQLITQQFRVSLPNDFLIAKEIGGRTNKRNSGRNNKGLKAKTKTEANENDSAFSVRGKKKLNSDRELPQENSEFKRVERKSKLTSKNKKESTDNKTNPNFRTVFVIIVENPKLNLKKARATPNNKKPGVKSKTQSPATKSPKKS